MHSSCEDDDELHQLLKNVQLVEPDSDGGNDTSRLHGSQVPLVATVAVSENGVMREAHARG